MIRLLSFGNTEGDTAQLRIEFCEQNSRFEKKPSTLCFGHDLSDGDFRDLVLEDATCDLSLRGLLEKILSR